MYGVSIHLITAMTRQVKTIIQVLTSHQVTTKAPEIGQISMVLMVTRLATTGQTRLETTLILTTLISSGRAKITIRPVIKHLRILRTVRVPLNFLSTDLR